MGQTEPGTVVGEQICIRQRRFKLCRPNTCAARGALKEEQFQPRGVRRGSLFRPAQGESVGRCDLLVRPQPGRVVECFEKTRKRAQCGLREEKNCPGDDKPFFPVLSRFGTSWRLVGTRRSLNPGRYAWLWRKSPCAPLARASSRRRPAPARCRRQKSSGTAMAAKTTPRPPRRQTTPPTNSNRPRWPAHFEYCAQPKAQSLFPSASSLPRRRWNKPAAVVRDWSHIHGTAHDRNARTRQSLRLSCADDISFDALYGCRIRAQNQQFALALDFPGDLNRFGDQIQHLLVDGPVVG